MALGFGALGGRLSTCLFYSRISLKKKIQPGILMTLVSVLIKTYGNNYSKYGFSS